MNTEQQVLDNLDRITDSLAELSNATTTLDTETRHTLAWIGVSLDSIADSLKTLVDLRQEQPS